MGQEIAHFVPPKWGEKMVPIRLCASTPRHSNGTDVFTYMKTFLKLPGFCRQIHQPRNIIVKTHQGSMVLILDLFDFSVLLPDTKKRHQKRQAKPYVKPSQKLWWVLSNVFSGSHPKFGGFMIQFDFPIIFWESSVGPGIRVEIWS